MRICSRHFCYNPPEEKGTQVTRHRPTKRGKGRPRRRQARGERLLLVLLVAVLFWAIVVYALFVEM